MKKIYLLFFLFLICLSISAQKNELALSFSKLKFKDHYIFEDINSSLSVSYFRFISKNSAIGIRASYQGNFALNQGSNISGNFAPIYNISLDLLVRKTYKANHFLSVKVESGMVGLRTKQGEMNQNYYVNSAGQIVDIDIIPGSVLDSKLYMGLVAGIGVDFKLLKNLKLGINYNISAIKTKHKNFDDIVLLMQRLGLETSVWF